MTVPQCVKESEKVSFDYALVLCFFRTAWNHVCQSSRTESLIFAQCTLPDMHTPMVIMLYIDMCILRCTARLPYR